MKTKKQFVKEVTKLALIHGYDYSDVYAVVQNLRAIDDRVTGEFIKQFAGVALTASAAEEHTRVIRETMVREIVEG
jgi:hypothetical protein